MIFSCPAKSDSLSYCVTANFRGACVRTHVLKNEEREFNQTFSFLCMDKWFSYICKDCEKSVGFRHPGIILKK